jgi:hypothetical protein
MKNGFNKKCEICKKEFYISKSKSNRKYCSVKCRGIADRKRCNISIKCFLCKKEFEVKRAWVRDGQLKFCSKNCKNKYHSQRMIGKNNPAWKNGDIVKINFQIRKSFKYRQWRSDIFFRDDFICQVCNKRGNWLEAHHCIKEFAIIIKENNIKTLEEALNCEELWNLNNGKTLCKKCHIKIHKDFHKSS